MGANTLPEGFTDFDMFAFGSALLIGGLLGFFLNVMSAAAFLRVREMRTPGNFFIFNLAVADIGLNINGLVAAYASYLRYWPFGSEGCQIHAFQGMVSILAAISFLGAVAWDRYHQYCTKQKMFWSTAGTISTIIWILAIFWAAMPLPAIGWGEFDFEPMRTCCTLDYTKGDRNYITYMLTITVLFLAFPVMILQSSYNGIYAYFKKTHRYKFNTGVPLKVLLFCWGPYVIMCIYACFENVTLVSPKLRMVLPVLAKTSPIFHAILYAYGNELYGEGLWQFLMGQKSADRKK
ncbi:RPE-retinal G protein-coupled receptor-like [Xyrauchen texanus]|uniref:RPE-retinal G protein-coupled receptor-like n=1 Tax=Xyrauchen texanus TaxID=154827 RepID=UPI0022420350|nr:RPE-retinal G protein-coupled receptor-like [Xyrauchen texanus]